MFGILTDEFKHSTPGLNIDIGSACFIDRALFAVVGSPGASFPMTVTLEGDHSLENETEAQTKATSIMFPTIHLGSILRSYKTILGILEIK
jgi:hypothetical protein